MKITTKWLLAALQASLLWGIQGERQDDCQEVGFARSGGGLPYQALEVVKARVLPRWAEEDVKGQPPYTNLPGSLKNVTRAAYMLEEISKELLALIRKTRVGKRCHEEWLLRGVEKHVRPMVQLDQELADQLGLVMSFRCMVGSPYPNVDGTCVSEESPDMGAIGSKFLRLMPSKPGLDGFSIRQSVSVSGTLPSGRAVSVLLRKHLQRPPVTGLFADWAHFVQRDIFSIPESPLAEGVDCCKEPDAEDCAPIAVPEDDPLHKEQPCFNYRRSTRAQAILGHRESYSLVSTYLDATPLYGPTNEVAFKRKTGYFGYLKGPEKLEDDEGKCRAPESLEGCFQQDDSFKVAPSLRALLLLEHNRIADVLAELNPHFDDPLLYNEARRILIAQFAALTYGTYLPTLLGEETVTKHFLKPGTKRPEAGYIKDVNPGVLTAFAVAAFRNPAMATEWRSSEPGREEVFDSAQYDSVAELPYQDILALDVQRARDHGLPGYISWRRFCEPGLVLDSWDDLKKVLPEDTVPALKELYNGEMEDIDAMVALLEAPVEGGVAGKTFTCIMADQFARLRTGNRLYWEHDAGMLTAAQKEVLVEASLASVVCSNLPVTMVPSNPLRPESADNPLVKCVDLKPLNLTLWTDTSLIESMKKIKKGEQEQLVEKLLQPDEEKPSSPGDEVEAAAPGQTSAPSSSIITASSKSIALEGAAADAASPTQSQVAPNTAGDGGTQRLTTVTPKEEL